MSHIRPLVKYHGGKGRIHQWIISHFQNHKIYLELFGGAASVLLNKLPSELEIYNEIEPEMFNLIQVVQSDFQNFINLIKEYKYNKQVFLDNKNLHTKGIFQNNLERAICFYIVKRMSRGGLGQQFSWSKRIYSTGPAEEHCWNSSLENLIFINNRLKNVKLLNKDVFDILPNYLNNPDCFIYLDPPYVTNTRIYKKAYNYEFSNRDHEKLILLLKNAKAKIIISGYESLEYEKWLTGWCKSFKDVANHSSQSKTKVRKIETLWLNYNSSIN